VPPLTVALHTRLEQGVDPEEHNTWVCCCNLQCISKYRRLESKHSPAVAQLSLLVTSGCNATGSL
jgi:hypothetical protein